MYPVGGPRISSDLFLHHTETSLFVLIDRIRKVRLSCRSGLEDSFSNEQSKLLVGSSVPGNVECRQKKDVYLLDVPSHFVDVRKYLLSWVTKVFHSHVEPFEQRTPLVSSPTKGTIGNPMFDGKFRIPGSPILDILH